MQKEIIEKILLSTVLDSYGILDVKVYFIKFYKIQVLDHPATPTPRALN